MACCLLLMMVTASCGDNSTGTDEDEPPEIPELTAAQPDFSYFDDSSAQKFFDETHKTNNQLSAGDAYGSASSTALTVQALFSFGQSGFSYFSMAENEEPEFKDGEWVWTYSITYEGATLEFKLTANINESAGNVQWAYYLSYTGGEEEFVDYKFMEGTTSLDGKSGDWTVFAFLEEGSSDPVMSYEWEIDDNENLTATFNFHEDDSFSQMKYVQNGNIHTLTLTGTNTDAEVYWDTDADHGYWWDKISGEQLCWDSEKNDVACEEIGL